MTTLVDVIFVDFLDAGSIPATSTNLRKAPVGTQVCQPEPFVYAKVVRRSSRSLRRRFTKEDLSLWPFSPLSPKEVAGACGGVLRRRTSHFGLLVRLVRRK
jgi:hypothetical protein